MKAVCQSQINGSMIQENNFLNSLALNAFLKSCYTLIMANTLTTGHPRDRSGSLPRDVVSGSSGGWGDCYSYLSGYCLLGKS